MSLLFNRKIADMIIDGLDDLGLLSDEAYESSTEGRVLKEKWDKSIGETARSLSRSLDREFAAMEQNRRRAHKAFVKSGLEKRPFPERPYSISPMIK